MESLLSVLRTNVLSHRSEATRDQLRVAIVAEVKRSYQPRRRGTQEVLGIRRQSLALGEKIPQVRIVERRGGYGEKNLAR